MWDAELTYETGRLDQFLIPIAAAIWSTDPTRMKEFPAHTLARFFRNHMFLDLFGRPIWRTIAGGSRTYVERLIAAGVSVERGRFRTDMQVALVNDGPVTLLLDSNKLF